jgi:hypothetical protein
MPAIYCFSGAVAVTERKVAIEDCLVYEHPDQLLLEGTAQLVFQLVRERESVLLLVRPRVILCNLCREGLVVLGREESLLEQGQEVGIQSDQVRIRPTRFRYPKAITPEPGMRTLRFHDGARTAFLRVTTAKEQGSTYMKVD